METAKHEALAVLAELPDDATPEDILRELLFQAKIRRGLDEAERGETISDEELTERVEQWLSSVGR